MLIRVTGQAMAQKRFIIQWRTKYIYGPINKPLNLHRDDGNEKWKQWKVKGGHRWDLSASRYFNSGNVHSTPL